MHTKKVVVKIMLVHSPNSSTVHQNDLRVCNMHLALLAPLANSISSGSEQYPGPPQSPNYLWRQNRDCCVVTRELE